MISVIKILNIQQSLLILNLVLIKKFIASYLLDDEISHLNRDFAVHKKCLDHILHDYLLFFKFNELFKKQLFF